MRVGCIRDEWTGRHASLFRSLTAKLSNMLSRNTVEQRPVSELSFAGIACRASLDNCDSLSVKNNQTNPNASLCYTEP